MLLGCLRVPGAKQLHRHALSIFIFKGPCPRGQCCHFYKAFNSLVWPRLYHWQMAGWDSDLHTYDWRRAFSLGPPSCAVSGGKTPLSQSSTLFGHLFRIKEATGKGWSQSLTTRRKRGIRCTPKFLRLATPEKRRP